MKYKGVSRKVINQISFRNISKSKSKHHCSRQLFFTHTSSQRSVGGTGEIMRSGGGKLSDSLASGS